MDKRWIIVDWTALQHDIASLPPDERQAAQAALLRITGRRQIPGTVALAALSKIIDATARGARRRRIDHAGDAARRVLIGARVRRDRAEIYRAAAARQGVSLYAWTVQALDAAAAADEGGDQDGQNDLHAPRVERSQSRSVSL